MRAKVPDASGQAFGLCEMCMSKGSLVESGTVIFLFQLKRRDNKKIRQRRQAPCVLSSPEYEGASI